MSAEILRTISLTSDGGLLDAVGSQVDVMPGDPIFRERLKRLAARDCARRKLLWQLLPLVSAEGRQVLRREIATWDDREARAAAHEILTLAGWPSYDVDRCIACGEPLGEEPDREPELCEGCTQSRRDAEDLLRSGREAA